MEVRRTDLDPRTLESSSALEYLAFHAHSKGAYAVFSRLDDDGRRRQSNPDVLLQAIIGGVALLRSAPAEALELRGQVEDTVIVALGAFIASERARSVYSWKLQRALLDWAAFLASESRGAEAESCCDRALRSGAIHYPDLHPRLVLLLASVLRERGEQHKAHRLLADLFRRRDLICDRTVFPGIVLALGQTALMTGQVEAFRRVLVRGLELFYTNLEERRAILALVMCSYRRTGRALTSNLPLRDKAVLLAHEGFFRVRRLLRPRVIQRAFERGFLGAIYVSYYFGAGRFDPPGPRPVAPRRFSREVLVTRAMGGIGDLLMMTPGLHALRRARRAPVSLALPRRYFPVFEGNPDVRLLDIHDDLDPSAFARWFNLTDCPAARKESRTAPKVRKNRIEIFARALGVRGPALARMHRRPRYAPSADDLAYQRRFFEANGLAGKRPIGIQLRAEETYRDYPHMRELVQELSRRHPVLVFDNRPAEGYDIPNVVRVDRHGLREAFALAGGCAVLVAPDSAFVHLAAALGIHCVALFGPTDGRVRTVDYPRCRFLDVRHELQCVPCWRNEEIPCALTQLRSSVCMGEISVVRVAAAVEEMLERSANPGPARDAGES